MHATQSNCCSALDFLSYEPCPSPKRLKLNALITRSRKSYSSVSMSHESKRLTKSSSDWLNSNNALIQQLKNAIFVFPVLSGSAEVQVAWGGLVKRLLIAYFTGISSAKNIKIRSYVSEIQQTKGGTFWHTVHIGWSDVTVICGHITISILPGNTAYCVTLSGKDLSRYSNKNKSDNVRVLTVLLRKWCHNNSNHFSNLAPHRGEKTTTFCNYFLTKCLKKAWTFKQPTSTV